MRAPNKPSGRTTGRRITGSVAGLAALAGLAGAAAAAGHAPFGLWPLALVVVTMLWLFGRKGKRNRKQKRNRKA